jgi:hypothetical protein
MSDGAFQRVATIATPFSVVADVQFDPTLDALWVVCDDACSGRTALYEVADGAFAATTVYEAPSNADRTLANEGFAISGVCSGGSRATFYADDNDTDGFSLRTGTYPCDSSTPGDGGMPGDGGTTPTPVPPPTPGGGSTPAPGDTAPGGSTPGAGASPSGAPVAPSESSLTEANRGTLTAPATARPGETITIGVGTRYAGQQVHVWMFSTPTLLGTTTVAADGTVTATIPADAPAGEHRIVVTAEDGTVLGWTTITIDPVTGALAFTGAEGLGVGAVAAFLLLAAGAGVLVVRRRRGIPASE